MITKPVLLGVALAAALAAPVHAQGCGETYSVRAGDTMGAIAGRCGTSVQALLKANPSVEDPARISIGQALVIPRAADAIAADWARERDARAAPVLASGRYTVRPGDSMARIATALGVPLSALIGANKGVDPFSLMPGQELALPGAAADAPPDDPEGGGATAQDDAGTAAAGADADAGETAEATVPPEAAVSLPPRNPRRDGTAAPVASETAREAGAVNAAAGLAAAAAEQASSPAPAGALAVDEAAPVPGKAPSGRGAAPDAAGDGTFQKTSTDSQAAQDQPARTSGDAAAPSELAPAQVVLEGRVDRGTECPILRTADGTVYSLVSQHHGFTPGDTVRIEGEPIEMSFCMQGQTVRVTSMHKTEPAQDG